MATFPAKTTYVNGDIYTATDVNDYGLLINQLYDQSPNSLVTAKGDLLVGSAAATMVKKTVGANNTVLYADSAAAGGVAWGQVTSAMITDGTIVAGDIADGAITSGKILDGTILNVDINASAAIAYSKLALTNSIVAGDITAGAITTAKLSTTAGEIAGAFATQAHTNANITLGGATSTCRSLIVGKVIYLTWFLSGGTPTATAAAATTITLTGVTFNNSVQVCVYQGPLGVPAYAKTTASSGVITIYSGMNQTNYSAGASITGISINAVFELA
jgi:hypothetical protein